MVCIHIPVAKKCASTCGNPTRSGAKRGLSDRVQLAIAAVVNEWVAACSNGWRKPDWRQLSPRPIWKKAIRRAFWGVLMDSSGQFC
jgi:hypothetical protein